MPLKSSIVRLLTLIYDPFHGCMSSRVDIHRLRLTFLLFLAIRFLRHLGASSKPPTRTSCGQTSCEESLDMKQMTVWRYPHRLSILEDQGTSIDSTGGTLVAESGPPGATSSPVCTTLHVVSARAARHRNYTSQLPDGSAMSVLTIVSGSTGSALTPRISFSPRLGHYQQSLASLQSQFSPWPHSTWP